MTNEWRNTTVVLVAALTAVNLLIAGFVGGAVTKQRERRMVIAVLPSAVE